MMNKMWIAAAALVIGGCSFAALLSGSAMAEDFPQGPKIDAPSSLPDPICDVTQTSDGDWAMGQWASPFAKWTFFKDAQGYHWKLDRKGSIGDDFGWQPQAQITGEITQVTNCTLVLEAGQGAFVMFATKTDEGRIFGVAKNAKGKEARFILRPIR